MPLTYDVSNVFSDRNLVQSQLCIGEVAFFHIAAMIALRDLKCSIQRDGTISAVQQTHRAHILKPLAHFGRCGQAKRRILSGLSRWSPCQ